MTLSRAMMTQAPLRRRVVAATAEGILALATLLGLVILVVLLVELLSSGTNQLDWHFLTSFLHSDPEKAGIRSALAGTLSLMGITIVVVVPIGIGAAIFLEEYASKYRITRIIDITVANLAGVPSIVYGMLGLAVFGRWFAMGESLLAAALTLTLVILPIVVVSAREALRAVPQSIREGALALGGTRWQTVRDHVLPFALPGVITGLILALSRAIGETAPLIMVGALVFVPFSPANIMDTFTALPLQIYTWADRPQEAFHELAAAAIVVLLVLLLAMNAIAIAIRYYGQRNRYD